MTTPAPDQLRWQVARDFAVVLDADNDVVAEVARQRVIVSHPLTAAEAFRQATVAGRGKYLPEADLVAHLTSLRTFIQGIAEMRKDGDDDGNGEPYEMENDDNWETLMGLIGSARDLLGIADPYPLPDPDPCAEADLDAEPLAAHRWNNHHNERGNWCRFSTVAVSATLAEADDKRCPHECPDSTIEPIPVPADVTRPDLTVPEASQ